MANRLNPILSYLILSYLGENAEKYVQSESKKHGICVAVSERLSTYDTTETYDSAVRKIVKNKNARVPFLFS